MAARTTMTDRRARSCAPWHSICATRLTGAGLWNWCAGPTSCSRTSARERWRPRCSSTWIRPCGSTGRRSPWAGRGPCRRGRHRRPARTGRRLFAVRLMEGLHRFGFTVDHAKKGGRRTLVPGRLQVLQRAFGPRRLSCLATPIPGDTRWSSRCLAPPTRWQYRGSAPIQEQSLAGLPPCVDGLPCHQSGPDGHGPRLEAVALSTTVNVGCMTVQPSDLLAQHA